MNETVQKKEVQKRQILTRLYIADMLANDSFSLMGHTQAYKEKNFCNIRILLKWIIQLVLKISFILE